MKNFCYTMPEHYIFKHEKFRSVKTYLLLIPGPQMTQNIKNTCKIKAKMNRNGSSFKDQSTSMFLYVVTFF